MPDPKLKYQQLLSYAKKLPPLPAEEHTDDNKVRGCVSQVRAVDVELHSARPHVVSHCAIPDSTWCFSEPQVGVCEGPKHYTKWLRRNKCLTLCLRAPYTKENVVRELVRESHSPKRLAQAFDPKTNLVCVGQVWVVPEVREGKVYWRADSDSALTKAGPNLCTCVRSGLILSS